MVVWWSLETTCRLAKYINNRNDKTKFHMVKVVWLIKCSLWWILINNFITFSSLIYSVFFVFIVSETELRQNEKNQLQLHRTVQKVQRMWRGCEEDWRCPTRIDQVTIDKCAYKLNHKSYKNKNTTLDTSISWRLKRKWDDLLLMQAKCGSLSRDEKWKWNSAKRYEAGRLEYHQQWRQQQQYDCANYFVSLLTVNFTRVANHGASRKEIRFFPQLSNLSRFFHRLRFLFRLSFR